VAIGIADAARSCAEASSDRAARSGLELIRARADRFPVDDGAQRVVATSAFARIHAAAGEAHRLRWAVDVPSGAVPFRAAARCDGVTDEAWRALADVAARAGGFADGGRMASRVANFCGDALDLRQRVGAEAWWTLTSRSVVLGDAHGVLSARLLFADVVTRVSKAVAQLSGRAVQIVDARHSAAPGVRIVGVARVGPGRALTLGDVVVDDAHGMWPTVGGLASWPARQDPLLVGATRI